ncbi:MAG: alpha/beta fold hydrolase [Pararhodobacter sp.]
MLLHSRRLGVPGGHPVVLAHCFLGHGGSWARMVEAFPLPLDALAPDLPGHGRSPVPADPGDFHGLVAGAIGGLVTRPSLLIGHSFGAAAMLRYALHHPGQVTGLVLIEPVFFAAVTEEPDYPLWYAGEEAVQAAVRAGDPAGAARMFLARNPGSPEYDRLPAVHRATMAAQMGLVAATVPGLIDDSGGLMAPGVMEGFEVPVLLIEGRETTPVFQATARALVRMLRSAELARIDGAAHMVPVSHPHQTAAAIHDWMQRTGQIPAVITENPRVL